MKILRDLRKSYLWSRLVPEKYRFEHNALTFDKIERWLDVQFRQFFSTTHGQLKTNVDSLKEIMSQLPPYVDQLKTTDFSSAKIHMRKLSEDHRRQLVEALDALCAYCAHVPEDVSPIKDFYDGLYEHISAVSGQYKRMAETVGTHAPTIYQSLLQIHSKINQNYLQAVDILEQSVNAQYLSMRILVKDILRKREIIKSLQMDVSTIRQEIEQVDGQIVRFTEKIRDIEEDPRYQAEKKVVHQYDVKFRHSFYELDMMDLQSKQKQLEAKKQDLLDQISQKEQQMTSNVTDADVHLLKEKIKKQLSVDIELVEAQ